MSSKGKISLPKSFIDDCPKAVHEGLLGTAFAHRDLVVFENHKILLRRDHKSMTGKVKILAGGGAGLEEAGFVGQGMLTGIVLGDIFVAPPVSHILTAIRELAHQHEDGILLLVKNYIGDHLNFGLAFEKAINENITIRMLLIGDDSSHSDPGKYGRRCLAGSVLVYKIAGAMAEEGKGLDDIFHLCRNRILTDLSTVNVCLMPSSSLKWERTDFVAEGEAMFGIGLYGQPGFLRKFNDLDECIRIMLDRLPHFALTKEQTSVSIISNQPQQNQTDQANIQTYVVLINNLGALSGLEESIIGIRTVNELITRNFTVVRLYTGTLMPLLDSKGFSITIMTVTDPEALSFLDAPTSAFKWPKSSYTKPIESSIFSDMKTLDSMISIPYTEQPELDHNQLDNQKYQDIAFQDLFPENQKNIIQQIINFAAEALISCEKQINVIDMEVGDGDAGTMMKKCALAVKEALDEGRICLGHPFRLLQDLGNAVEKNVGGITGALYSIFFTAASKIFFKSDDATLKSWCEAFKAGTKAIKCYGRAEIGERTLLDVLYPAVEVFELTIRRSDDVYRLVSNIACTCEYHAEETKKMKPMHVRGNRPKTNLVYPDAGAHAAAVWIRAVSFESDLPAWPPGIFLWKFITAEEADYILRVDTSKKQLLEFFDEKSGSDSVQQILLYEIALYSKKKYVHDLRKTSALMGIVYYTHLHFKASYWRTPQETYCFFKESLLHHSVEQPPISMEVFTPEEARDALLFFIDIYMRHLPLVRLLCLPHYKLRLNIKPHIDP